MAATLIDRLAEHGESGHVNAYAGFGKTYLIAETVKRLPGCQLILTHTHAGVDAIRKKLGKLNAPSREYWVDTIAGFALRLCLAYRKHSQWSTEFPQGEEWSKLYTSCVPLLGERFIQRVLQASFTRIFVDEYQDCSLDQHEMTQALSQIMPTTVLGDPLQAVFDFGELVDWSKDVEQCFPNLGSLSVPHRWREAGASDLGDWLIQVRSSIEAGIPIDLRTAPKRRVAVYHCDNDEELRNKQISTCKYFRLPENHTVAAIHGSGHHRKANCQRLAKSTSGVFSSIEEIEGKRLRAFITRLDVATSASEKLQCILTFLKEKCMSGVGKAVSAPVMQGKISTIRSNTKNPELAVAANAYLSNPTHSHLGCLLEFVRACPQVRLYARDLFCRLRSVVTLATELDGTTLMPALDQFQASLRHRGRPTPSRRVVATTLLIKGLQYDHTIVLDASTLGPRDLYVALTRGSRTLTILTANETVNVP